MKDFVLTDEALERFVESCMADAVLVHRRKIEELGRALDGLSTAFDALRRKTDPMGDVDLMVDGERAFTVLRHEMDDLQNAILDVVGEIEVDE